MAKMIMVMVLRMTVMMWMVMVMVIGMMMMTMGMMIMCLVRRRELHDDVFYTSTTSATKKGNCTSRKQTCV